MRKKMKKRHRKQLAFLVALVLVASVMAIVLLTPAFNISKIEVYGNSVLKDEQIIQASGIVKGINIFEMSVKESKNNIKSLGYVESVKIKRSLPSTVKITIVEEVGVAYLKAEDGFVIIAADGRCIDINDGTDGKNAAKTPDLPLVKGMKNVKYKVGKTITTENKVQFEALTACLHEFSKNDYVFNMREIDMTDITDIKFYYYSKDLCVTVGTTDMIDYKMECFGRYLEEVDARPTGHINLNYVKNNQVIHTPLEEEKPKEEKAE